MGSPLEQFSAYLDGRSLADAEVLQLRAWIAADEANAREFVQFGMLHAAIADRLLLGRLLDDLATHRLTVISPETLAQAMSEIEATSPRIAPILPEIAETHELLGKSQWIPSLVIAASVAFLLLGAWALRTVQAPTLSEPGAAQVKKSVKINDGSPAVVEKPVVAVVAVSLDARWAFDERKELGAKVREGARFDLLSGVVQLDMVSGAVVVLQGPCRAELQSVDSMRLASGKAAVRIQGAAESFVISTATATVTDLGTEFGVDATMSGDTLVSVFDGSVELATVDERNAEIPTGRSASGPTRLQSGFETSIVRRPGGRADMAPLQPVRNDRFFVRADEVDVRVRARGGSAPDRLLAAHYERQRIAGLLAYQGFDAGSFGTQYLLGAGVPATERDAKMNYAVDSPRAPGGLDVQGGDAFVWFDTAAEGTFGKAGLIGPSGRIGKTGTEVWMTWSTQRLGAVRDQWSSAGLSLMFGNRDDVDEPLFLGQATNGSVYCVQSAWGGAPPPDGKRVTSEVDVDSAAAGVQRRAIDDAPHTWIIRVEFGDQEDHVSLWLDADPSTVGATAPQATMDVSNVEFDRVRLAAHRADETWRYGELAVARNPQALEQLARIGIVGNEEVVDGGGPK